MEAETKISKLSLAQAAFDLGCRDVAFCAAIASMDQYPCDLEALTKHYLLRQINTRNTTS